MIQDILTKIKRPVGLGLHYKTDYADPHTLIYAQWHSMVQRFSFTATKILQSGKPLNPRTLVPAGSEILRYHIEVGSKFEYLLFRHREHSIIGLLHTGGPFQLHVHVAAPRRTLATSMVEEITRGIEAPKPKPPPPDDKVRLKIWQQGVMGPESFDKIIRVPTWGEVTDNYPPAVGEQLHRPMVASKPSENDGKIILWYGEPGTGKTSAIRTLMREWKPWCEFHYIADPEKMFQSPNYLLQVGVPDVQRGAMKWRLVIAEDTDEFLKIDARSTPGSGAALSRLLNFSDGILGQGSNTIFLLTTNERVDNLHPAIIRPGRCYQHLCFDNFTATEALEWLPDGMELPTKKEDDKKVGYSLADLVSYRKGKELPAPRLDEEETDEEYDDDDDELDDFEAELLDEAGFES